MSSPILLPKIIIMGRPNVGKSTLFNRLVGYRRALVHNLPGVTRDRLEEICRWWVNAQSYTVRMVDTGGLGGENWQKEIDRQVGYALQDAQCILYVVDAHVGTTPFDEELLRRLDRAGLPQRAKLIGILNKLDTPAHEEQKGNITLRQLHWIGVSAEHNRGMEELKEAISEALPPDAPSGIQYDRGERIPRVQERVRIEQRELARLKVGGHPEELFRIAIVGKPNVGKSTLVNALMRQERMIVSPIAGTTVDAVDSQVELAGQPYVLVDTAGLKRKDRTADGLEVLSMVQTKKALERSDLAILVLDGELGLTDQDEKIGGLIEEAGCSVILFLNKWDTQKGSENYRVHSSRNGQPRRAQSLFSPKMAEELIRKKMAYLHYAPLQIGSALLDRGLDALVAQIPSVLAGRDSQVVTHELTRWAQLELHANNPRSAKVFYAHQTSRHPPTFVFHVNEPDKLHFSLRRHLTRGLRTRFGFKGTPLRLLFKEAQNRRSLPRQ